MTSVNSKEECGLAEIDFCSGREWLQQGKGRIELDRKCILLWKRESSLEST